jgi:hypothetical protein
MLPPHLLALVRWTIGGPGHAAPLAAANAQVVNILASGLPSLNVQNIPAALPAPSPPPVINGPPPQDFAPGLVDFGLPKPLNAAALIALVARKVE